jgi:predicted Zn-dependent protease
MKNIKLLFSLILTALISAGIYSCREVPVTGRKQFSIMPDAQVNAQALQAYNQFLDENKSVVLPDMNRETQRIKTIGQRISAAVMEHSRQTNYYDRVKDFKWEFNVVDDKAVNAWCMPGGKVVFYTGILPVCQNDDAIAIVMGHEIAHAVAGHGGERMSQTLAAQGILTLGQVGDAIAQKPNLVRQIALQAAGAGTQLGLLAYSRQHESEADKIGLIYAAMAGYNPDESVAFWKRMAALSNGQKPPELLSTHPSDSRRIADLQKQIPDVKAKYYKSRN